MGGPLAFLSSAIRRVASGRIIGRVSSGSGRAEELTPADVRTLIDVYTTGQVDTALSGKANTSHSHAISDVTNLQTTLDVKADLVAGVVPTAQIPAIAITEFLGSVASEAAMLALSGQKGDWCIRTDTGSAWIITGADPSTLGDWTALPSSGAPVSSVNGQTGVVVLGAADVGAAAASHNHTLSDITDAGTAAAADVGDFAAASHNHAWSQITSGVPTTGAGFGLTDVLFLSGDQTASGVKTFSGAVLSPIHRVMNGADAIMEMVQFSGAQARLNMSSGSGFYWASGASTSGIEFALLKGSGRTLQLGLLGYGNVTLLSANASGTNTANGNFTIKPGASTGNATPSKIVLCGTVAGSSGSTAQSFVDVLFVGGAGDAVAVVSPGLSVVGLSVKGAASQTANLTEWRNVFDVVLSSVGPTGRFNAPASTTAGGSLLLPHGTAPTSPVDGEIWTTTAGIYVRVNGSTVGPLGTGGGSFLPLAGGLLTGVVRHTNTNNNPSGTTQTIDWTVGNVQTLDLGSASGAVTLTFTPPASANAQLTLKVIQGATPRDINWPGSVIFDDDAGAEPTWSVANKHFVVSFLYDGTSYDTLASRQFSNP